LTPARKKKSFQLIAL